MRFINKINSKDVSPQKIRQNSEIVFDFEK